MSLLTDACRIHHCMVHAYVLMTNHVHLLITPETPTGVSLVLRDLGRDYVRQINQAYCIACYRYIELNPVRAGMVMYPSGYRWSSFNTNALGKSSDLLTPHESWLALGNSDKTRLLVYRDLFDVDLEQNRIKEIRYGVRKGLPTGNEKFKQQIEEALFIKLGDGKRGRPKKT